MSNLVWMLLWSNPVIYMNAKSVMLHLLVHSLKFSRIQKLEKNAECNRIPLFVAMSQLVTIALLVMELLLRMIYLKKDFQVPMKKDWLPTIIENNVSIGSGVTILPVKIAMGCVIGAGSVVTKSLKEKGIYAGNPAKLIRKTLNEIKKFLLEKIFIS